MEQAIQVEVVFATATRQELVEVELESGATVADAIEASGIKTLFPNAGIETLETGIWGRPVERGQLLQNGDRVEIYRPLERVPRDARRELARIQRLGSSS